MLNGLADYIFGSGGNAQSERNESQVDPSVGGDDEWILINVKDTRSLEDEKKSREASSRSSPVLVADPEIGVMEASTFGNFIGENHSESLGSDSESVQDDHQPVQRLANRRVVADLLQGTKSPGVGIRSQQAVETESKAKDITQGKMKRANLVFEIKATKKTKQRKSRVKNSSGRNNDRKCQ